MPGKLAEHPFSSSSLIAFSWTEKQWDDSTDSWNILKLLYLCTHWASITETSQWAFFPGCWSHIYRLLLQERCFFSPGSRRLTKMGNTNPFFSIHANIWQFKGTGINLMKVLWLRKALHALSAHWGPIMPVTTISRAVRHMLESLECKFRKIPRDSLLVAFLQQKTAVVLSALHLSSSAA